MADKPSPRNIATDPYLSFRFGVIIDDNPKHVAGFNEATGLTFETAIEPFREGGFNSHERQLVGPTKCPERLVLKRGLSSNDLWSWYKRILGGDIERRKQLTIILRDYAGADVSNWKWVFQEVCPVKWTGPQFRAGTAEVAFETIELVHRGLKPG